MQLLYEGTDITDHVDIVRAVHRDASGGRLDSLEIEMENAARWYAWGPRKDERIELLEGRCTTGMLYIDMILPAGDRYRMTATSAPSAAHRRAFKCYEHVTLAGIMRACAAECGMEWRVFGLDENAVYPFVLRRNEKCLGFLQRIATMEGAVLKCVNGRLTLIGIEYAQALPSRQVIEIMAHTPGVEHRLMDGKKFAGVNVITPYARASAMDVGADNADWLHVTDDPAFDDIQAARWARGRLISHNRLAETLTVPSSLNPGMTAMAVIHTEGTEATAGRWLVDEAEHDFVNQTTKTRMVRCITSVR